MQVSIASHFHRLAHRLHGETAALGGAVQLTSGASLETWAFNVAVEGSSHDYILRRRAGEFGLHSIGLDVEAAVIQAAASRGVATPPFVYLCSAEDGFGQAHVTRRVAGESLGRKIATDAKFDGIRPRLAFQCGEQLAKIHATVSPSGLQTLDAAAVLANYERTFREIGARRPVLELAFRHLRSIAPSAVAPVLLHGDFRNGNLIVDAEKGIAAVLDWELAHCGDPAEDLGWLCVNSWRFGVPEQPVGGFGNYSDLLAGYRAAGGADISLQRVRYWQAVGSLKWAVMCLIMFESWASGKAASVERPAIGRRVSEAEIDLLNLLEAGL